MYELGSMARPKMGLKKWRLFVLAATVVAVISHMPVQGGDSCTVGSGVLRCPDGCQETFGPSAPVLPKPYKLEAGSSMCQPSWVDLKRILPGIMVSHSHCAV